MNNFNTALNLNDSRPLINRKENYHLSRKLLTVHAIDRDQVHFPDSNEFSIKCPQAYTNVHSIRLTEISFPESIYNFSNKLNNNNFYVIKSDSTMFEIKIPDGFYTTTELQNTLRNLFKVEDPSFEVIFLKPESKFIIGHSDSSFVIGYFDIETECKNNNHIYSYKAPLREKSLSKLPLHLGCLYNLGFNEQVIESTPYNQDDEPARRFNYWQETRLNIDISHACISEDMCRFLNRQPIYLELDKFNVYDEVNPYPKGSNNMYNNFSNSRTNSAFVKISPRLNSSTTQDQSKLYDNNSILFFDPPLQRVQTLKFRFRYHDGRLVDFNNQDINFTLEINELHNEIVNKMNIRGPIGF
uniref:Uncharacterized protein n=1 Tax=viral metagenome TaxID=1070528 RepID=A0A6C0AXU5_9ZZZZ|tara:strand:- start:682 stop:1749 length:1068 start_codon:yes stop_codon:yes gene_type:complete